MRNAIIGFFFGAMSLGAVGVPGSGGLAGCDLDGAALDHGHDIVITLGDVIVTTPGVSGQPGSVVDISNNLDVAPPSVTVTGTGTVDADIPTTTTTTVSSSRAPYRRNDCAD